MSFYIRKHALLCSDAWKAYQKVTNPERHIFHDNKSLTNKLEAFNNFMRQRCSRLVRKTKALSKKVKS
ncbi:IS1 family transposase [Catalinimonas alkaloidigena]|uniref:IS1 family transposase n=1 Tax=Catalinimonas alkaloidigena TaxID=1075417 RepID=UPI003B8A8FA3